MLTALFTSFYVMVIIILTNQAPYFSFCPYKSNQHLL